MKHPHHLVSKRSRTGQSITVLLLFITVFVVGPIGFLCYEISLYSLAKQQLRACVDSAALAAGTTTASSNSTNDTTTQLNAEATALQMFQQNSIIGYSLSSASQTSSFPNTPAPSQASLYFEFLDPVSRQPVPLGSSSGKIIQVTGTFSFVPAFAKFTGLGVGPYPIIEVANGGLPQLDVVLCFDISASMDDFTTISIVDRYNGGTAKNQYNILAQGPLYTAFRCTNATGTAYNATYPQTLDAGEGYCSFTAGGRGTNNGAVAPAAKTSTSFTDVVVNLDSTNTFSTGATVTYSGGSYSFPANNIGCLVEASRGNMESVAIATAAGVPYTTWGVTPKSGYYAAYNQAAMAIRHPISDAIAAAINFFTVMNNDCDVHFSLVTFSTNAGTTSTQTCPGDYGGLGNVTDNPSTYTSNSYPSDPYNPMPPNPGIMLNPTTGTAYSNFSTVNTAVQSLIAYGGTNIAGALNTALNELKPASQGGLALFRPSATKAVVLFTDGLPTVSSLGGDPSSDSRGQASAANAAGIPIYCIGLCLVPSLQASQTAILTDQNTNATTGGIAGISGNGAAFYQATSSSQLNAVFENVARALVQLVR